MSTILTTTELTVRYGEHTILDGATLAIDEGDRLGLVGRNGCGKTTFLRILAGLQSPDRGNVTRRRDLVVSYLPQDFMLDAAKSVEENIREGALHVLELIAEFESLPAASRRHHLSWLDPHKVRKITIVGSKKMVVFYDMEASEKLKIYDKGVGNLSYDSYGEYLSLRFGDITIPNIKMAEPLRAEAEHFIQCIQSRKQPKTRGWDGLEVVKTLVAAQQSLKQKGFPISL